MPNCGPVTRSSAGGRIEDTSAIEKHLCVDTELHNYLRLAPHLGTDELFQDAASKYPDETVSNPKALARLEAVLTARRLADVDTDDDEAYDLAKADLSEWCSKASMVTRLKHMPEVFGEPHTNVFGGHADPLFDCAKLFPGPAFDRAVDLLNDDQVNELARLISPLTATSTVMAKAGDRLTDDTVARLAARDPGGVLECAAERLHAADHEKFRDAVESYEVPPRISLRHAAQLMDDDQFADRVAAASDADLFELLEVPEWAGTLSPARLRGLSLRMRNAARPGLHPDGA